MIRSLSPSETDILVDMADRTGVFKPLEIDTLRELLDDYHNGSESGHQAVTIEEAGRPIGFAYFAPTPMTDGTWHLYWIVVDKAVQARGTGGKLMAYVEAEVACQGGRMLLIETSSLPSYELTRRFYTNRGYELEATVRDFYSDGDHQVIFRKRFSVANASS